MPQAPPFNPQQALGEALNLHRQGRLDEAEKLYTRVLKMRRDHFDALHLLGMLNHQRGKPAEAYRLIIAALKADPRSADALANLALVLHSLKRDAEAMQSLDRALAIAPDNLNAHNARGILLSDLNRPAEALAAFDRLLAAQPQNPSALYNRGNALRSLGREADAIATYDRALAAMPSHVKAWHNRGLALQALNRHREAVASYGKAVGLQPDYADAHFNAGAALLTLGDYRAGLPEYEWRWQRAGMSVRKDLRKPLWLGEAALTGKTILLHAEQGLGDTVMFARYAPVLARQGAKVVLEVQPELKGLLAGLADTVVARGAPLPPHDLHCPLASLPLACKTELSIIPAEIPYLRASEERIAHWRTRLEVLPAPRVALVWSGRATHANDRNRSIGLKRLEPLLAVPGVSFVSLQRELKPDDAALLAGDKRIAPMGDELRDFADTAAVLALADLVVCVDTSVAHVAAALGRPAFILLPFQPDWRWLLDRDTSPWYPNARLFRQPAPGDWDSVIARMRDALAADYSSKP